MTKRKFNSLGGLVFSTNPDLMQPADEEPQHTPEPGQQKLRVKLDKKQRAGKIVTLVEGFEGQEADLAELGKRLKTKCGTGGSAKEGEIIIQGDYKEKIVGWLKEWGYSQTKGL